ncbi:MAG: farnesyltranstransferase [Micavibrio sp.]|nr:farnesyltranstransferase [Micavibrio sp.]|tara:strand:+ start:2022 stop:3038 length:1017 start_codon:yes stop_codon:yes gene_type:complete
MQAPLTQSQENLTSSPLEDMSQYFSEDMLAVNTLILDSMESDVALVKQIASYLIAAGGKRVRPLLTLAGSALCGNVTENSHLLAAAVECIHTATLLHDDVVDESEQRRGNPSSNSVFGNQAPILVGDFLFSRAFQLMVRTQNIHALKILADASAIIAEGEVLQLSILGKLDTPLSTYFKVIEGKTAALFAAACESGALVGDASQQQQKAAHDFGLNLGMVFQIIDDLIDYAGDETVTGKKAGDDFREGKVTLPIYLAYEQASKEEKAFFESVFKTPSDKQTDFNKALNIIEKYDAITRSKEIAQGYYDQAITNLDVFPDTAVKTYMTQLLNFTLNRKF